jgi:hypothetical protein
MLVSDTNYTREMGGVAVERLRPSPIVLLGLDLSRIFNLDGGNFNIGISSLFDCNVACG